MKILLTTGTTEFSELVEAALTSLKCDKLIIQTPIEVNCSGAREIANIQWISFADKIIDLYQWADIVITHAGAGSVFKLLELQKPLVVVPNQFRADKHQIQLANYVDQENYASVCFDLAAIQSKVDEALNLSYDKYINMPFNGEEEIMELLFESLNNLKKII